MTSNSNKTLENPISESQFATAAAKIMARCKVLGGYSEEEGRLTRTFCSPPMKKVHSEIDGWVKEIGGVSEIDAAGNLIGKFSSAERPVLLIGSHLDTVVDAGKFDGAVGVLMGLAVAELLNESKVELAFNVEIVGFSEEEGVRFNTPYIGSRAIAGCFEKQILDVRDSNGISIQDALEDFGCKCSKIESASYFDRNVIGFVEAHIEQGPVLEIEDCPVGVVSEIAGQTRATFVFEGRSGHAGTVPHEHRCDALAGAAEFIVAVERLGTETEGLFATVGEICVEPNVSNVIPCSSKVRLDLRHGQDDVRTGAWNSLVGVANQIADRRKLKLIFEFNLDQSAVQMDARLTQYLTNAVKANGWLPKVLTSGAGHDAVMMARLAPTSMLFIRCRNGVSHHPDEHVEKADVCAALKVLFLALIRISDECP